MAGQGRLALFAERTAADADAGPASPRPHASPVSTNATPSAPIPDASQFETFLRACFEPADVLSIAPGALHPESERAIPEHGGVNSLSRDAWLERAFALTGKMSCPSFKTSSVTMPMTEENERQHEAWLMIYLCANMRGAAAAPSKSPTSAVRPWGEHAGGA